MDIWATWCAPCRHELLKRQDVKAFEDFASKNNIVILYICCDNDGNNWKEFIKANNLTGYHILENHAIYKDFHSTFSSVQNRNGKMKRSFYLPRHIIINRNGKVADSTAGSQGSLSVYTNLKKMLDKTSPL